MSPEEQYERVIAELVHPDPTKRWDAQKALDALMNPQQFPLNLAALQAASLTC